MKKLLSELKAEGFEKATELEDCSEQVQKRLQSGCECDQKCFSSLKTELVYRHRCNIAELSKGEHDMYLMGVVLTSLADPSSTTKHKERQRHRNKYVFRGKEVCQDAFLYLENITLYQLKSIRKHVTNHGVVPRIHKNKGKKPHNVFQLDHYQLAHRFVEDLLQEEVLRPVMVWIHGGSFTFGSGAWGEPDLLLEAGVVFVSINYRFLLFSCLISSF